VWSSDHLESGLREVLVERESSAEFQAFHQHEAGRIHHAQAREPRMSNHVQHLVKSDSVHSAMVTLGNAVA
jgi:hypothetical protein